MKGLRSNYGHEGAVNLKEMITWKVVTEGMSTTFFVDSNFKFINRNRELLDSDGIIDDDVNPPQYSEVLEDRSVPRAGLISTSPLCISPSNYLMIDFD